MAGLVYKNFSVVIPSYNEEKTITKVVSTVLEIPQAAEVIVVDDGSDDNTKEAVKQFKNDPRFVYLTHSRNKGKGAALHTGVKKAKNEIVLFLDADLTNIDSKKIKKIVWPVLKDEVDFSRGSFKLARGRVTEIAVKPMMKILFPELYFEQPISGQVCAKRSFLESINLESHWGVDIGILLDAIVAGQRIVEVDIGELDHKARSVEEKAEMAEEVLRTMIKKAGLIQHKYKLVVFTLDNTLIKKNSLSKIFKKLGLQEQVEQIKRELDLGKIEPKSFLKATAWLLKGQEKEKIENIALKVESEKYAAEIIKALKKRKYQVAIISSNLSPIVSPIAKQLGVENYECVEIESKNGILTGEITKHSADRWLQKDFEVAFQKAFQRILHKAKMKAAETILVANSNKSIPLLKTAGLGIAYRPDTQELKEAAEKTIHVLPEVLAIIE